jgi:acyl carrier protein
MQATVDITTSVKAFLLKRQQELGVSGALEPESAVFSVGLLDSVSLMELVVAVERDTGQTVDMLLFDPATVDTVGELVQALAEALGA